MKERYLSLDVFRGATIFLMIVVNTPGEWGVQYAALQHAEWHGFTLTDFVFPAFLFTVGNSMSFVMEKFKDNGNEFFWKKILKRSTIIFIIGFLLSYLPFYDYEAGAMMPLSETRILGVLQRIAICYFFSAIIIYYSSKKVALLIPSVLLLAYWAILYFFGDSSDPYSMVGYAGNAVDFFILGSNHMYTGEGIPFDPEGILSTIPAIVNVILGYFAGQLIRKHGNSYESIAKLMVFGVCLVLAALWWHQFFPINKKIWTSSYVLLTSGICLMLLATFVYYIEIQQKKNWTYFFEVFGRNPLFIYALSWVLSTLLDLVVIGEKSIHYHIYDFLKIITTQAHASFVFALIFTLFNWAIGYILDKKKIYIKV